MIRDEREARSTQAEDIAQKMMVAARTAPKGKGIDVIECAVVTGEHQEMLAQAMEAYAQESGMKFFLRDAHCVRVSDAVCLVGTRPKLQGLNCGHCGFATCGEKHSAVASEIIAVDVCIALVSEVSKAAEYRVDTRVLFSAGLAAQQLALLGDGVQQVYAIAVSISSKSPYFDRPSRAAAVS